MLYESFDSTMNIAPHECIMDAICVNVQHGPVGNYVVHMNEHSFSITLPDYVITYLHLQTGASMNMIVRHMIMHNQYVCSAQHMENDFPFLVTLTILSLNKEQSTKLITLNEQEYYRFEKSIKDQFNFYFQTKTCESTYGVIDERDVALIYGQVDGCESIFTNGRNIIIGAFKRNAFDIVNTIMELIM